MVPIVRDPSVRLTFLKTLAVVLLVSSATLSQQTSAPLGAFRAGPQGLQIRNETTPVISNGGLMGGIAVESVEPGNRGSSDPPAAATLSPGLASSFDAIDFDVDASYSGFYHIPPDPHGAAGPTRLVNVVNTSIQWHVKSTGAFVSGKRLGKSSTTAVGSFFESLSPVNGLFDPKVIYDQYEGRFVVVALEKTLTASDSTSRILVAVSATSDPGGTWYFLAIDSKLLISGGYRWADYPGIAVDDKAVYITNNMFGFTSGTFYGSRLWIIHKGVAAGFYAGGAATVTVHDPGIASGLGSSPGTLQPAHMFGTPATGLGTYLVTSGWSDGGGADYLNVITVSDPLGTPAFASSFVALGGNIHDTSVPFPDAPQLGSATLIETNDARCLHTVWRSDELYGVMTIVPPSGSADAGETTALWFRIGTPSLTLLDKGTVGAEDLGTGTYTFFPSIAVDASLSVVIGFAASSSSIYPGAYVTGRYAADAAGTNRGTGVLRAGTDYYVRTFGGSRNRWGDYSGACIDPSDGSFWVFNEYAKTRGTLISGEEGRWATAWGNLTTTTLPVQLSSFRASIIHHNTVRLEWSTVSEVNNYGFEVQQASDTPAHYATVPNSFVPGHGTSSIPHEYSFSVSNVPAGTWYFRLRQIDLDGTSHVTEGVRADVLTSVADERVPAVTRLEQNYPNPFNPTTTIRYRLSEAATVRLTLFDVLGQEVRMLVDEWQTPGERSVVLDASDLPSGVYFYRMEAGRFVDVHRMLVMK